MLFLHLSISLLFLFLPFFLSTLLFVFILPPLLTFIFSLSFFLPFHHHHVPEGLGMLSCSLILKMKLVPPPETMSVKGRHGLRGYTDADM